MRNTLLLSALSVALTASAQNTCLTALPVTAGNTYTVTGFDGLQIPIPVCASGGTGAVHGEWYTYTAPADYNLTVSTDFTQNAGIDTRFHVYTGVCGNLTCIGGDDDSGSGNLSIDQFNVSQGTTYIIAFDDRFDTSGFVFSLSEFPSVSSPVQFSSQTIAVTGSAYTVVDMNDDQLDDIVATKVNNVQVHYQQQGGGFTITNIATDSVVYTATWSIAAGDLDDNGQVDLMYGNGSGVSILMANTNGTGFTEVVSPQYVFSQRGNMVDINNDGNLDAFMCHDVEPNVYFLSDGQGGFNFVQGGLGDTPNGGNYGSIWIDYDNDHDIDLFIAKCRGGNNPAAIDQLHRNDGNGVFTEVAASLDLAAGYHQSWSSAWADYDNDGDMDVVVGASSFTGGGHRVMRNDGTIFTDVAAGSGWDLFQGTGIEHVAHDFNNDGWVDVLTASSTVMVNNGDMTFTPIVAGASTGAVGDLNNDGYLDVHVGTTSFINDGGTNNYIRVHTVGTVSNLDGIGARVQITTPLGTQIRDVKSGDGFKYMSSLLTHFGLGADTQVDELTIYWPSGIVNTWNSIPANTTFTAVEDAITDVSESKVPLTLSIAPVPTTDELVINTNADWMNAPVSVVDINGRTVLNMALKVNRVDVRDLAPGVYVVRMLLEGNEVQRRFVKE
ncbi:MAG: VCBS repeat-containing protein [Flavobacteriales bacterium]|nr:MAG: VCBS repeat-containing protein [Flavobacteriales bacterium]